MRAWKLLAAGTSLSAVLGCANTPSPQAKELLTGGSQAFSRGDYAVAVEKTDAFLRDNSAKIGADEAYFIRGLAKYNLKDLPGARSDLNEALNRTKLKQVRVQSLVALGDIAWDLDDMALAERHYRQALDDIEDGKAPSDHARYRLGCVLQRRGAWDDADLQFSRVVHFFGTSELGKQAARRSRCRAWTVQAGAYRDKARADLAAKSLQAQNLPAKVEALAEDGNLLYVLQVGRYVQYEQAVAAMPAVKKLQTDAYVTVTR